MMQSSAFVARRQSSNDFVGFAREHAGLLAPSGGVRRGCMGVVVSDLRSVSYLSVAPATTGTPRPAAAVLRFAGGFA